MTRFDAAEVSRPPSGDDFVLRTHNCGELRKTDVGSAAGHKTYKGLEGTVLLGITKGERGKIRVSLPSVEIMINGRSAQIELARIRRIISTPFMTGMLMSTNTRSAQWDSRTSRPS